MAQYEGSTETDRFLLSSADIKLLEIGVRDCAIVMGFLRVGEIDTMNERYQAEVYIEAKWIDNSDHFGLYDPKVHWNVTEQQQQKEKKRSLFLFKILYFV